MDAGTNNKPIKKESIHTTEAEKNIRVNETAKAMLNGYVNRRILIQYLSETFKWDVGERTYDNYIKEAKELLSVIDENELSFEKSLALNRLDSLYTMNFKIHDFRECRNIIESRAKILGINAPTETKNETTQTIVWDEVKTYEAKHKAD